MLAFLSCTLLVSVERAPAAQSTPAATADRNKSLVEASFKAWANGTGSPYDLLADNATWTIVGRSAASKAYESKEAFMRDVIRPFNARMRDPLKPSIRRIYADGNTVIVFFDARGTARDGKPYVNTYAWFLELKDGKVIAASAFFDSLEFNDLWSRVSPAAAK
jgi:ketosteroid isomerase-like protein